MEAHPSPWTPVAYPLPSDSRSPPPSLPTHTPFFFFFPLCFAPCNCKQLYTSCYSCQVCCHNKSRVAVAAVADDVHITTGVISPPFW